MHAGSCRSIGSAVVVALCLAGVASASAQAPSGDGASDARSGDFLVGNLAFVLLHEFGHAVIREFHVPLLGLEEDSADTIAAVALIDTDRDHPGAEPRLTSLLATAALGNLLTWRTGLEKSSDDLAVWSQHSLSVRRFARLTCLLYGSDTGKFQWVADTAKMPDIRADWCEDEFEVARHGVDWLTRTYGAPAGTAPHGRIRIVYREPKTAAQTEALRVLRDRQLIEQVARFVDSRFRFPRPFAVTVKSCGAPNAYWDPGVEELYVCHELLEAFVKLGASPEARAAEEALRGAPAVARPPP
jgi:hypothetical protein